MIDRPRIAFIVLAHTYPRLLRRLIQRLAFGGRSFFVHVDSKSNLDEFERELASIDTPIFYVVREDGRWGGFGIVKATLNGLMAVVESNQEFDHIVLLSGQTYPIKSNEVICRYFEQYSGKSILHCHSIPDPDWRDTNGGIDRINRYHFMFRGYERTYPPLIQPSTPKHRLLNLLFRARFPRNRTFPKGMTPYGGSQWWCITPSAARYIVAYCRFHPEYLRYHRYTLLGDEIFFHSIIMNAQDRGVQSNLINDFSVQMDWSLGYCKTYTMDDFDQLANSEKLFARKFAESISDEVLDAVDTLLLNRS